MLNIAETLNRWFREARPSALATVVNVRGSAPLPTGTSDAVDAEGNAVGSISSGCVEGAVYELCRQVLRVGGAPQRSWFGYSDDDAFAVGLTCGGELDVFVQRVDRSDGPHLAAALGEVVDGRPAAVAQVIDGPDDVLGSTLSILADGSMTYGTLGDRSADRLVAEEGRVLLRAGRSARVMVGGSGGGCPEPLTVHVHVAPAPAGLRRGRLRHRAQPALSARGRERLNYHPSRPHPECRSKRTLGHAGEMTADHRRPHRVHRAGPWTWQRTVPAASVADPKPQRSNPMRAAVLHAPGDVRMEEITAPTDAIIRLCGSNLWPYRGGEAIDGPTSWDAVRRCRRGGRP